MAPTAQFGLRGFKVAGTCSCHPPLNQSTNTDVRLLLPLRSDPLTFTDGELLNGEGNGEGRCPHCCHICQTTQCCMIAPACSLKYGMFRAQNRSPGIFKRSEFVVIGSIFCSACNWTITRKIFVCTPAKGRKKDITRLVWFVGTFLRGVLDKVGVQPEVVRIGKFKSAGDQLLRSDMSVGATPLKVILIPTHAVILPHSKLCSDSIRNKLCDCSL